MIQDTQNRKNTLFRAFMCVLIGVLGVYLLMTPLSAKASNPYISNIDFYKDTKGVVRMKFFVNTSFNVNIGTQTNYGDNLSACVIADTYPFGKSYDPTPTGYSFIFVSPDSWVSEYLLFETCNTTKTYAAGNTYEVIVSPGQNRVWFHQTTRRICVVGNNCGVGTDRDFITMLGEPTTNTYFTEFGYMGYPAIWPFQDNQKYYFSEYPTLTITYPLDEAEIASAFYITGSYTLPAGSTLNKLMAYFGYDISGETKFYEFYQDVSPPSGSVNIRVAGLPARSYFVGYSFINTSDPDDYYMVLKWYHIHIVLSIPPELPDGETPPIVFDILDPASYYTANSSYASSTLLFDNLSGALKPIILTIGNNLTFFSSKFEQSKAQETGETMAGGVLVVRTYANNLNTFFSDLPIAQALFLYLLLLVVVAVFRIIKNLINLIKP